MGFILEMLVANQTWLVHSDLKISDGLADWIDTRL